MDLLLKMNERLDETEKELEQALKNKESIIPVVTTQADTGTGTSAEGHQKESAQVNTLNPNSDELAKQMESLKLRVSKLQTTKLQLTNLEQKYDVSKKTVADQTREVKRLEKLVKALEKDLALDMPLKQINEILWNNIKQSIKEIWSSVQIIFEQNDLVKLALNEIEKAREELRHRPKQANQLIQFLNTQTRQQLVAVGIEDRTCLLYTSPSPRDS